MDSDVNEPVNLGNPVEHTVAFLAQRVIELVGSDLADRLLRTIEHFNGLESSLVSADS